jgi:hypothetical protein
VTSAGPRKVVPGIPSARSYLPGFEEDDHLRSDFIRQLTLEQLERGHVDGVETFDYESDFIPKTLVQYWHDPRAVPLDVRRCLSSWEPLSDEGVTVRMFSDASARSYIAERYSPREVAAFDRCRHPAMRSDYLRMCFVLAEGGLYVDADDVLLGDSWREVFCGRNLKVQPLAYDIRIQGMVSPTDLRRSDLSTKDRIFYVNNNPIAAPAGHPVLRRALSRSTQILLGKNPSPEIQSTTGPGNLTASLAAHGRELQESGARPDFELLINWDLTAETCWHLAYRSDDRNWRNMDGR